MLRVDVYVVQLIYLLSLCTGVMSACGGVLNATQTWQTFHSPGYPTINYASGLKCVWHIRKSSQGSIRLESVDMAIEDSFSCNKDSIYWMQNGRIKRVCGDTPFSMSSSVSTRTLAISFRTDSVGSYKGFKARYRVVSAIPVSPVLTPSPVLEPPEMLQAYAHYYYVMYTFGKLARPEPHPVYHSYHTGDKPSYKDDKVWVIDTMNEGFVVIVTFAPSPMECATDYVKVLDGRQADAPLLERWCDGSARTIRSTGTTIRIHFHTPANTSHSGIYFKYKGDIAPGIYNVLNSGVIGGGTIGFLVCMSYLVFFIFVMYRRRKGEKDLITTPIISASDNETGIMTGGDNLSYETVSLQVIDGTAVLPQPEIDIKDSTR